jgi:hypothetical protein
MPWLAMPWLAMLCYMAGTPFLACRWALPCGLPSLRLASALPPAARCRFAGRVPLATNHTARPESDKSPTGQRCHSLAE